MDWGLVVGILVFLEGIVLLKGLQMLSAQIEDGLEELDQTLGEALTNVLQNFPGGEPISPIQNALAQVLLNSVGNQSSNVIEIARDSGGQFLGKE
jgi:hypothetical protein|tara:strand:- start:354 stop:638 length:285 start_codon:yes stop_codon:yes gene_type:complete